MVFIFLCTLLISIFYFAFPNKIALLKNRLSPNLQTKINKTPQCNNSAQFTQQNSQETFLIDSTTEIQRVPAIKIPNFLNPVLVASGGTSKEVKLKFYIKDKSKTLNTIYLLINWDEAGYVGTPKMIILNDDGRYGDKKKGDHIFTFSHIFKPFFINQKGKVQFFSFNFRLFTKKTSKKIATIYAFSLNTLDTNEIHIDF